MRRVMLAVLFALFSYAQKSEATSITYVATDLADINVGQDLWKYDYVVSGFPFLTDDGFQIYFDYTKYEALAGVTPIPSDWDLLLLQPDVSLSSNGVYDQLAKKDAPSLATVFSVEFRWLGPGTPGAQQFAVYHQEANGDLNFIRGAGGLTVLEDPGVAPVPEPSSMMLLGSGAVGLVTRAVRRRRARRLVK